MNRRRKRHIAGDVVLLKVWTRPSLDASPNSSDPGVLKLRSKDSTVSMRQLHGLTST